MLRRDQAGDDLHHFANLAERAVLEVGIPDNALRA